MRKHDPTEKSQLSDRYLQRKSLWFLFFTPLALLLMVSCSLFPLRLPFAIPFLDRFYEGEQSSTQPVLTLTAILQNLTLPSDQNIIPSDTPGRLTRAASTQTAVQGETDQPQQEGQEGVVSSQTGTLTVSGTPRPTGTQTRVPTSTWYIYYFPTRTSVSSSYTRTPTRTPTRTVTRTPTKTLTPTINQTATAAAQTATQDAANKTATAIVANQTATSVALTEVAVACAAVEKNIAYNADANGDGYTDVMIMDVTGVCREVVFAGTGSLQPLVDDWSPDGNKLVLEWNGDLYLINTDGTGLNTINTSLSGSSSQAAWSSDNWLVFRNVSSGWQADLYRLQSGGGTAEQLTNDAFDDSAPAWSPDNNKIAFVSNRDGNTDLYILTIGGGVTRFSENTQLEDTPRWSPNGNTLLFSRKENSGAAPDLFLVSPSDWSAIQTEFTNASGHDSSDSQPAWSSNGNQILWISDRDGNGEIYMMSSGGGAQAKINNITSGEQHPRWKP
jgi:TolB protein